MSIKSIIKHSANDQVEEEITVCFGDVMKLIKNKKLFFFGITCCTLAGFHLPIFAILYGNVISIFALPGNEFHSSMVILFEMFIALTVFTTITVWFFNRTSLKLTEEMIKELRLQTFKNILSQEVSLFDYDHYCPTNLNILLSRDPPIVKNIAGARAGFILMMLTTLILVLGIAVYNSWQLTLVVLIFFPLLLYVNGKQAAVKFVIFKKESLGKVKATKLFSECVQNIKTVQSYCLQEFMIKIFMMHLSVVKTDEHKNSLLYGFTFGVSISILNFMSATIYYWGSLLLRDNVIMASNMYRINFSIVFAATTFGMAALFIFDIGKAKATMKNIVRVMHLESKLDPLSTEGYKKEIKGKIELRDVWFEYPTRRSYHVLKGIDLTIEPGQTVALVGGSGCGKSTIVALLERFYIPHKGSILIDNMDISAINVGHLRNNLGLVTQEPTLFDRTIRDNIAYGAKSLDREVTEQEIIEAAMASNIHEFIISLPQGYETVVGENGTKLSGGQKQRIAIARALIRNPKILLLDEATSALDAESEKIVQEALDNAREGRTCIIIAHRLSTIKNADKIVVIHNGVVAEQGTHDELKEHGGLYYDLIKHQ